MTPVRLKPVTPRSQVKHSTIEPLCSLPQGHNLNKLGRGPIVDAKALGLVVPDKKIVFIFSLCKQSTTCDPRAGQFFGPRRII